MEVSVCSQGLAFFRKQTTIPSLMFQGIEIRVNQLRIAHTAPPPHNIHTKEQGYWEGGHTTDPESKAQLHFSKLAVTIVSVMSDFIFDQGKTNVFCHFLSALGLQSPRTPKC